MLFQFLLNKLYINGNKKVSYFEVTILRKELYYKIWFTKVEKEKTNEKERKKYDKENHYDGRNDVYAA